MVILVVCLWHEPDSQLFDTEATETDGNQMPFIACLYHLCVPITSVMNTGGTTWHEALSLALSQSTKLPRPSAYQIKMNAVIQSVIYAFHIKTGWILCACPCAPFLLYVCMCISLCTYGKCLCACVCVFVLQSVILPHYVLTQRLELQVAPGVWEQFTSCWCLSVRCTHTHTHRHTHTHIHTICMQLYICSFHSLHMCTCIRTPLHWHVLLCVTHSL